MFRFMPAPKLMLPANEKFRPRLRPRSWSTWLKSQFRMTVTWGPQLMIVLWGQNRYETFAIRRCSSVRRTNPTSVPKSGEI